MKSNKICRLPWSVLLVVLLATVGAMSTGLTSAASVSADVAQLPIQPIPKSVEPIPALKPEVMEENVELTKRRAMTAMPYGYRVNPDYRATKRDLGTATALEEETSESENDLSKRRMMIDNPYGRAIYSFKRDHLASGSPEEGMSEPVAE